MPTLDADMAAPLAEAMGKVGIDVRLDTRVEGIEAGGGDRRRGLRRGRPGGGGGRRRPVPGRPRGARARGAAQQPAWPPTPASTWACRGAIRVDRRQRTSADGVWAAGDCCESFHVIARAPVHIALGTVANKQGRVAGINLAGGYAAFPGVLGTAVSKVCHTEVGRIGPERARGAALRLRLRHGQRGGHQPGRVLPRRQADPAQGPRRAGQPAADRRPGVGSEGAAKRIDVLATAMWAGMTVDDVVELDLGYAPPFGPVWDPVHLVARQLVRALDGPTA